MISLSTISDPASSSTAVELIFSRLSSAGGIGVVSNISPSGLATRYEQSLSYDGRKSLVDSAVGSSRMYFWRPPSPLFSTSFSTATIA